jgi:hypothetical protein
MFYRAGFCFFVGGWGRAFYFYFYFLKVILSRDSLVKPLFDQGQIGMCMPIPRGGTGYAAYSVSSLPSISQKSQISRPACT